MASAVTLVGAFLEEEIAAGVGDTEKEFVSGCVEHTFLDETEFDVENGFEFGALELAEDHHLIKAVHELRRKLAASGFDGGALDFLVNVGLRLVVRFDEAVATAHEVGDFVGAEVGGHEDDGLGEVHAAVVAKGQRGFVQHAEE